MPYLGKQAEEGGALIRSHEFLQGTDTSTGTSAFTVASTGGDYVRVFLNGVLLQEGASNDYTKTTSAVTITGTAPADGDILKIDIYESITIWDTVSSSSGGTFTGDVTLGASDATYANNKALKAYVGTTLTDIIPGDGTAQALGTGDSPTFAGLTLPNDALSGDDIDGGTISNFTSTGIDDNATSTAITIDANENVGIGVVPESDWQSVDKVFQVGTTGVLWQDDAEVTHLAENYKHTNSGDVRILASHASDYYQSAGTHVFRVAPSGTADSAISWTTAMTIKNDGDVEIGSYSAVGASVGVIFNTGTGVAPDIYTSATSTGGAWHYAFINPNGVVGSIATNGSSTSYNTSSDYRLKENVVPMSGSIDRLKQLKPSRFNFIVDADTTVDGFLAHEAQVVVPEAISGEKDAMRTEEYEVTPAVTDEEGNITTEAVMGEREVPDMQGIDQGKLVPLLVGALQEAIARIETLESA